MIIETIESVLVGSIVGVGISYLMMRYFGNYILKSLIKSIGTKKDKTNKSLFQIDYDDDNNFTFKINLPNLIKIINERMRGDNNGKI